MKLVGTSPDGTGTYKWYELIDSPTALFTGNEFETPPLDKSTSYFVSRVTDLGCEGDRMEVVAGIAPFMPVVTPHYEKAVICKNESHKILLDGAPAGSTYYWYETPVSTTPMYEGEEFETGPLTDSRNYFVRVIGPQGCISDGAFVAAAVDNSSPSAATANPLGGTICQNDASTITLANPQPNTTYRWYGEATGGEKLSEGMTFTSDVIDESTLYYVAAVNSFGCEGSRAPVTTNVIEVAEPSIDSSLPGVLKSSASVNNQWYLEGELLDGDVDQVLEVQAAGLYTVRVSFQGCEAWSGSIYKGDIITSLEDESRVIKLYPNPASEVLTIHVLGSDPVRGQLYDEGGRSIGDLSLVQVDGGWKGELDVRSFAKGLYLLRLSSVSKSVTHKVIIR